MRFACCLLGKIAGSRTLLLVYSVHLYSLSQSNTISLQSTLLGKSSLLTLKDALIQLQNTTDTGFFFRSMSIFESKKHPQYVPKVLLFFCRLCKYAPIPWYLSVYGLADLLVILLSILEAVVIVVVELNYIILTDVSNALSTPVGTHMRYRIVTLPLSTMQSSPQLNQHLNKYCINHPNPHIARIWDRGFTAVLLC